MKFTKEMLKDIKTKEQMDNHIRLMLNNKEYSTSFDNVLKAQDLKMKAIFNQITDLVA